MYVRPTLVGRLVYVYTAVQYYNIRHAIAHTLYNNNNNIVITSVGDRLLFIGRARGGRL